MLDYTLTGQLLTQRAIIQRDEGELDAFGGEPQAHWVTIGKPDCRFWWWREGGARSASKEYATPQRTINFTGGGILVPLGTDIEDGDRLYAVVTPDEEEEVIIAGPFRIVAVELFDRDHTEAAVMRP